MAYEIRFTVQFAKSFGKLDKRTQRRINEFLVKLQTSDDPRNYGKPLNGQYQGMWRYRVGDYRLLAQIKDKEVIIHFHKVDHRKQVYR